MTNVLIVNAGIRVTEKHGKLSAELVRRARERFEGAGFTVTVTDLNDPWTVDEEVAKVKAADLILVQTPVWAMSTPWHYTRWQDEVLTHPDVCGTDGRTRTDPSKKYGTGGFLQGKRYWLSTTWNAPKKALDEPGEFFDGRGIEEVLMPLHKQFEYMAVAPFAPTFAIHDVYKNPDIPTDLMCWDQALETAVAKLAG
ncbi:NAD(P)H-dependent oxidoreductase [Sutterella sp.]|uniref:NAD(P)H-dependent oxidoreductase n=1 Tax=Sutterella sp. TaxID=1981025 RepID=UPI0026DFCA45|nr:NAD(P)H-dependent oxidoreductase [Sutterella sp.]MDO5532168.1 NAD(P)H-dependent oxidoreductase [Sutterella sp.]